MNSETINPVILVHVLGNLKKKSAFCSTVFEGHNFLHLTINSDILWHISISCSVMYLTFVDPCIIVQVVKKNPTRCNSVSKFLLFHIYMKLNMFRATHRPSSGA